MSDYASEASNVQTIATLLQEEGYRAKIEGDVVRSMTSGFKITIYPYRESIQLRLGINKQGTYIQLRHVNEFNAKYRFAKVYLDMDGDIVLEYDFLFDYAARKEEAATKLHEIMAILDGFISYLKDKIDEAVDEAKAGFAIREEESSQSAPETAETPTSERPAIDTSGQPLASSPRHAASRDRVRVFCPPAVSVASIFCDFSGDHRRSVPGRQQRARAFDPWVAITSAGAAAWPSLANSRPQSLLAQRHDGI